MQRILQMSEDPFSLPKDKRIPIGQTVYVRLVSTNQILEIVRSETDIISAKEIKEEGHHPKGDIPWLAPAFFDLQINGGWGLSFQEENIPEESYLEFVRRLRNRAITRFFPTIITDSFERIQNALRSLTRKIENSLILRQAMIGFHLEGPYISSADGPRGAHPAKHVRNPSLDEFKSWQDAADGRIRLITLAPELTGAMEFIAKVSQMGVTVAIGHTNATAVQIRDSVSVGAKLSTHLGNGCHAMLARHDNPIWPQLIEDKLAASFIADGMHLTVEAFLTMWRCKPVDQRILTCDASSLAGLPAGRYSLWGSELEVQENGRVAVPNTPFLGGSGLFTNDVVRYALSLQKLSLAEVIAAVSSNPLRLLGFPCPKFPENMKGSWVCFDSDETVPWSLRDVLG